MKQEKEQKGILWHLWVLVTNHARRSFARLFARDVRESRGKSRLSFLLNTVTSAPYSSSSATTSAPHSTFSARCSGLSPSFEIMLTSAPFSNKNPSMKNRLSGLNSSAQCRDVRPLVSAALTTAPCSRMLYHGRKAAVCHLKKTKKVCAPSLTPSAVARCPRAAVARCPRAAVVPLLPRTEALHNLLLSSSFPCVSKPLHLLFQPGF
jgi:hypothetical protein